MNSVTSQTTKPRVNLSSHHHHHHHHHHLVIRSKTLVMELEGRDLEIGDVIPEQQADKRGKKHLFKSLNFGKWKFLQQHESRLNRPLEGHIESKGLVSGSEEMKLVFHDTSIDADTSNYLTRLLYCRKICPGKANESEDIAFEILFSQRINQDRCGTTPTILILSKESADVRGSPSKQSLEKVKLTEHTIILQVSSANSYTCTEEVAKEIAEMFPLHYNEGIQVVYLLSQIFYVTTIKGEKPIKSGVPVEMIWEPQHQLKIIEKYLKAKEDLVNRKYLEQIPSKKIKY